ncbi:unnamed protein product [Urochloa decumbens]|uniref:BHLH domain-containing protein n=1 Tax=Urochloa decumbens TaxID=240449 RepID=A0ABC9D2Q9_9POAL
MAQDAPAHEDPVGRGRSSAPPPATSGMWEPPPRQMQPHAPFPSWSPYAGTFATAFGEHLSPAAADSRLPSERFPEHAWNQSAPSTGARGGSGSNFLSLLEAKNVTPEMFEDVPAACDDYLSSPLVYSVDSVVHGSKVDFVACYDHEAVKGGSQKEGFGAPTAAVQEQMISTRVEIQSAPGYSGMWSERERLGESSFGVGSLPDASSFGDYRSAAEFVSGNSNRHEQGINPGMGSSSSGSEVAIAATKKSKGRIGGNAKKSKLEASHHKASTPKAQTPKVKLAEKITALQQIVSPFGKTDTSSVLFETIKYIKFLHEQLRLFSEPYVTKSAYKGHTQFGGKE